MSAQNSNPSFLSALHQWIFGESFDERLNNPALGQFDLICRHGIWTWASGADRKNIYEFVDKKLRSDGLFYIS